MQATKDNRLGTENITRLMISLAIPSVLAQIVNVLYNIVDRIYIGRIPGVGAVALTGVGVTFPIIHDHFCLFRLCQRRGCSIGGHCAGTGRSETGRKDPGKLCFHASIFYRDFDGVFLRVPEAAALCIRGQ